VSAITHQDQLLYADFLLDSEQSKRKTISEALHDVDGAWDAEEQLEKGREFIELQATAEHEGEEQPLPRLRVSLISDRSSMGSALESVVAWGKGLVDRLQSSLDPRS
jgi:hypothetical protein